MSGLKNVRRRYDDALSRIDWKALERLLAVYYRDVGWWVEHVGTGGTGARFDGGVDLRLRRDAEVVLVQCKHWNAKQVPHNAVHELIGIMVNESATGAILVSSGEFTRAAIEAAQRQGHVKLIDGETLRTMLGAMPESLEPTDPVVATVSPRRTAARTIPIHPRTNPLWQWLTVIAALGFFLIIYAILVRTADTAEPPPETAPDAARGPTLQPTITIGEPAPVYVERVVVPQPPLPPPTQAEIRESQRKADEAMRLIEQTTPEM